VLGSAELVAFVPAVDLVRSRAFYEGSLGLTVLDQGPGALVLDAAGTTVRVTKVASHVPAAHTVLGWRVADIDSTVASLGARGVTFTRYAGMGQDASGIWTAPSGDRVAWCADPDGNVLSLTELASRPA
jgi:predicted enzyme related to lactoylglutathione lyase